MTQIGDKASTGWRTAAWSIAALMMLIPLAAMLTTDQVGRDPGNFLFAGILTAVALAAFELAVRLSGRNPYRVATAIALAAGLALMWMNLAVGIIGNEENAANSIYFGIIAAALVGSALARFEPRGMARAMIAAAVAQVLVAVVVQMSGTFTWVITGFFAMLWLTSAALFAKAARGQERMTAPI